MDKMAQAVTRVANACETMMQKEMAAMPWIHGAAITFGVMLFIALTLFIVLEIQWIRHWSYRNKRDRALP